MGGGATTKQEKRMQKMQDQLNIWMEVIRGKTPSIVEAMVQKMTITSRQQSCPIISLKCLGSLK